ncbi:response regulator transcription factor [Kineosporia sp. J2-2]|uniref:Response regulator transcription factor n=1 Tax=Kineosporia corallincola TaxID=2835133 RepID=A0ABS5TJS9_9ACTN|nr:LuxR C-terminal-related transcriptional regulator [Kineosporia corallincola]MBT0769824.1 response regulator transcription factor [Kineosporia corallincola]
MPSPAPLRVAVLTDDPLDALGIEYIVDHQPDLRLAQPAESDVLAVSTPYLTPDMVQRIRRAGHGRPMPAVMILEKVGDPDLLDIVEGGLRAVIWRPHLSADRFLHLVRLVGDGHHGLSTQEQAQLVQDVAELQGTVLGPRGVTHSGLEQREVELVRLLAEGCSSAEIAVAMQYSERQVKHMLSRLLTRLQMRSRSQVVAFAVRSGLL